MAAVPNPYSGGVRKRRGYSFSSAAKRETREEFMFGSEPIIAYRLWKIGKPTYDALGDFLSLLADAHDAGADNPYRHALAQTRRTLLLPIANQAHTGAWLPGVTESRCTASSHEAPDLQCECGFWALRDEQQLVAAFESYTPDAWGTVKMWGRFCEFEKGYRAQYAYPERITLLNGDEGLAYELAQSYGCEVGCGDVPAAVTAARESAQAVTQDEIESWAYQRGLVRQQTQSIYQSHFVAMQNQLLGGLPEKPKKKWWQT